MNVKQFLKKMLNMAHYNIYRIGQKIEYTPRIPFPYSTYSPWFEKWFQGIYKDISSHTLVKEDRCYIIYRLVQHALNLKGDLAECGVYQGGTAYLIAKTIEQNTATDKKLFLFDTFAGMPNSAQKDRDGHGEGDFGDTSYERVKKYLSPFPSIEIYKGIIPETFEPIKNKIFSFAHIDVDIYPTTMDCCHFFYSRLTRGGILIFDDYGFASYKYASRKAVDEFFLDKIEKPVVLPTGQCFLIKL